MTSAKVKSGLGIIKAAIDTRAKITECYRQYNALTRAACLVGGLKHADVKRSVDALYYLGGGWPSENSKGRMEALLENFVGVYRVMSFIGQGHLITQHLGTFGMAVSLDPEFEIENIELSPNDRSFLNTEYNLGALGVTEPKDLKDLLTKVISACRGIQGDICSLADDIKDTLRPRAMAELEVEDAEYDRLHGLVKLASSTKPNAPTRIYNKKAVITASVSNYNAAITLLGK